MTDVRMSRLAKLLVNYSTAVKPGDWVGVLGDVNAMPVLREVFAAVLEAGGNPSLIINDDQMMRTFLRHAGDDQIAWLDPMHTLYYENADVYIRVNGSSNTRA